MSSLINAIVDAVDEGRVCGSGLEAEMSDEFREYWKVPLGIAVLPAGVGWSARKALTVYISERATRPTLKLAAWLEEGDPSGGSFGASECWTDYDRAAASLLSACAPFPFLWRGAGYYTPDGFIGFDEAWGVPASRILMA